MKLILIIILKKIAKFVKPFNFELQWKFNKKSLGNNIYIDKILERIGEFLKISKTKIILDIDRQFDFDIFNKSTNWKFISSLLTTYSKEMLYLKLQLILYKYI